MKIQEIEEFLVKTRNRYIIYLEPEQSDENNLQDFTEEWVEVVKSSLVSSKITEKPTIISTENLEIGTFLITYQDGNEDNDDDTTDQYWTILAN